MVFGTYTFLCAVSPWFFGQTVEGTDLAIVGLLVLLEGILSIDNALVLGLLAKRLPPPLRPRALSYGLIGAFVFRFLAIAMASILLKSTIAKFLGGAYLVYIALKHLLFSTHETDEDVLAIDETGSPQIVDLATHHPVSRDREELELKERMPFDLDALEGTSPAAPVSPAKTTDTVPPEPRRHRAPSSAQADVKAFWWTVFVIELTDIAFAVDSIVAAIGVVGSPPRGTPPGQIHPKLWVVVVGGFLGVIVMRFAAALFIRLLDRFPRFETAAYLLVLLIGGKLLADWAGNSDWSRWGWTWNDQLARSYVDWLAAYWPLKLPAAKTAHPHLLDFHDLRRPECILFWLGMLGAFGVGFLGGRKPPHAPSQA